VGRARAAKASVMLIQSGLTAVRMDSLAEAMAYTKVMVAAVMFIEVS
jgi:hypothetical protein